MDKSTDWRYKKTISFLSKHCDLSYKILDLGTPNPLSELIQKKGYQITNTEGENLDLEFNAVFDKSIDIVTAFEIFEHMLAPFNILNKIQANKLIYRIPAWIFFYSCLFFSNNWFCLVNRSKFFYGCIFLSKDSTTLKLLCRISHLVSRNPM